MATSTGNSLDFKALSEQVTKLIVAVDRLDKSSADLSKTLSSVGNSGKQINAIVLAVKKIDKSAGDNLRNVASGLNRISTASAKIGSSNAAPEIAKISAAIAEFIRIAKSATATDLTGFSSSIGRAFSELSTNLSGSATVLPSVVDSISISVRAINAVARLVNTGSANLAPGELTNRLELISKSLSDFAVDLSKVEPILGEKLKTLTISLRAIKVVVDLARVSASQFTDDAISGKLLTISNTLKIFSENLNLIKPVSTKGIASLGAAVRAIRATISLSRIEDGANFETNIGDRLVSIAKKIQIFFELMNDPFVTANIRPGTVKALEAFGGAIRAISRLSGEAVGAGLAANIGIVRTVLTGLAMDLQFFAGATKQTSAAVRAMSGIVDSIVALSKNSATISKSVGRPGSKDSPLGFVMQTIRAIGSEINALKFDPEKVKVFAVSFRAIKHLMDDIASIKAPSKAQDPNQGVAFSQAIGPIFRVLREQAPDIAAAPQRATALRTALSSITGILKTVRFNTRDTSEAGQQMEGINQFLRMTGQFTSQLGKQTKRVPDITGLEKLSQSLKNIHSVFMGGKDSNGNSTGGIINQMSELSKTSRIPRFVLPGFLNRNDTVRDIRAFARFWGYLGKELGRAATRLGGLNIESLRIITDSISKFARAVPQIQKAAESLPKGLFSNLPGVRFFRYKEFRSFIAFAKYISAGMTQVAKITAKQEGFENLGSLARSMAKFAYAVPTMIQAGKGLSGLGRFKFLKIGRFNVLRDFFAFARFAAKEFGKIGNIKSAGNGTQVIQGVVASVNSMAKLVTSGISNVTTATSNLNILKIFVSKMVDVLAPLKRLRLGGKLDLGSQIFPAKSAKDVEQGTNRAGAALGRFAVRTRDFGSRLLFMNRGLKDSTRGFNDWSNSTYYAIDRVGQSITRISQSFIRFGGVTALMRSGGVQAALNFDDLSTQLSVFGANIPLEEAQAFANEIGIKYPQSSAEALQAILDLAKAGQDLPDIKNILPSAADLASLGDIDLSTSTTGLINLTNSFSQFAEGVPATFANATKAADLISAAANISTASVAGLLDGLSNVGPTASQFGLSLEETLAILTLFEDAGVKGAEAGTQLRSVLQTFQNSEALEGLQGLGVALYDATGQMLPFSQIVEQISSSLRSMTEEGRIKALGDISEAFGARGLSILVNARSLDPTIREMQGLETAADSASRILESVKNQIGQLSGSFETLRIEFFRPFIERGVLPFVKGLRSMVDYMNKIPQDIKDFAAGILIVVPAIVTLVGTLGIALGGLLRFTAAITALSQTYARLNFVNIGANLLAFAQALIIAAPIIVAVGGAIAALTVSFNVMYDAIKNNTAGAGTAFKRLIESVGNFSNTFGEFLRRVRLVFDAVFGDQVQAGLSSAAMTFTRLFNTLRHGFEDLSDALLQEGVFMNLIRRLVNLREPIRNVINFVKGAVEDVSDVILGIFQVFRGAMSGQDAGSIAEDVFGPIGRSVVNLVESVSTAVGRILTIFGQLKEGLIQIFITIISGGRGINGVQASLTDFADGVIVALERFITFVSDNILLPLQENLPAIIDGLDRFVRTVLSVTAPLREFISLIGQGFFDTLTDIADILRGTEVDQAFGRIVDRLGSLLGSLGTALVDTLRNLGEAVGNQFLIDLANSFEDGTTVSFLINSVFGLARQIAEALYAGLLTIPDRIIDIGRDIGSKFLISIGKALKVGDIGGLIAIVANELGRVLREGVERAFTIAVNAIDDFLDLFQNRVVGGFVLFFGTALVAAIPQAISAVLPRILAFITGIGQVIGSALSSSISLGFASVSLGGGVALLAAIAGYAGLIAYTVANDPDGRMAAAGGTLASRFITSFSDTIAERFGASVRVVSRGWGVEFFSEVAVPIMSNMRRATSEMYRIFLSVNEALDRVIGAGRTLLNVSRDLKSTINTALKDIIPGDLELFFSGIASLPIQTIGRLVESFGSGLGLLTEWIMTATNALQDFIDLWLVGVTTIVDLIDRIVFSLSGLRITIGEGGGNGVLAVITAIGIAIAAIAAKFIGVKVIVRELAARFGGIVGRISGIRVEAQKLEYTVKAVEQAIIPFDGELNQATRSMNALGNAAVQTENKARTIGSTIRGIGTSARTAFARLSGAANIAFSGLKIGASLAVADALAAGWTAFTETRQIGSFFDNFVTELMRTVGDAVVDPLLGEGTTQRAVDAFQQLTFVMETGFSVLINSIGVALGRLRVEIETFFDELPGGSGRRQEQTDFFAVSDIIDRRTRQAEDLAAIAAHAKGADLRYADEVNALLRFRFDDIIAAASDMFANELNPEDVIAGGVFDIISRSGGLDYAFQNFFAVDTDKALDVLYSNLGDISAGTYEALNDVLGQNDFNAILENAFSAMSDAGTLEENAARISQIITFLAEEQEITAAQAEGFMLRLSGNYAESVGIMRGAADLATSLYVDLNGMAQEQVTAFINTLGGMSPGDRLDALDEFVSTTLPGYIGGIVDQQELAIAALRETGNITDQQASEALYAVLENEFAANKEALQFLQNSLGELISGEVIQDSEALANAMSGITVRMAELAGKIDSDLAEAIALANSRLAEGITDAGEWTAEMEEAFAKYEEGLAKSSSDTQAFVFTWDNLRELVLGGAQALDDVFSGLGQNEKKIEELSDEAKEYIEKKKDFDFEEGRQLIEDAQAIEEKRKEIAQVEVEALQEQKDKEAEFYKESVRNYEDYQASLLEIQRDAEEEIFDAVLGRDAASAQRAVKQAKKQEADEKAKYDLDEKRRKEDFADEVAANARERAEKLKAAQIELQDLINKQARERQMRIEDFNREINDIFQKALLEQGVRNQTLQAQANHGVTMVGIVTSGLTIIENLWRNTFAALQSVTGPPATGTGPGQGGPGSWDLGGMGLGDINAINRNLIDMGLVPLPPAGSSGYSNWGSRIGALAAGGPVEPWSAYKVHDTTSPELLALRDGTSMLLTGKHGGYVQPLAPQNRSGIGAGVTVTVDFRGMSINTPNGTPNEIAAAIEDRVVGRIADTINAVVERKSRR